MVRQPLRWIRAFLRGTAGTLIRTYRLSDYLDEGPKVQTICDASPWGIGAILAIDGVLVAAIFDEISKHDEHISQCRAGSSSC